MIKLQGPSRIINYDESLTLYRIGATTYKDGKVVQSNIIPEQIPCNVQPFGPRDLLLVPEGDRFIERFWIYTNPQTAIIINDRVVRNGIYYQVQGVEYWGSYARAHIMRIDVGPFTNNEAVLGEV